MIRFIRQEKIYILLLLFIVAVNLMSTGGGEKVHYDEEAAFSTMTFEEMGVTEEKVASFLESGTFSARFFRYSTILGFFIFIWSLVLNIVFIFRRKKIDFKTLPYRAPVSWGIPDLFRATLIIIFLGYVIGIMEGFILRLLHLDIGMNLRMILNTFFIDVAAGMVILYFVIVKYRGRLSAIGLKVSSFFRNISSGITAYVLIMPFLLVILLLCIWFLSVLGYSPPPQPVFEVFMKEERSRVLLFLTIFVSVFGPIVEEMFFRGFMYSAIKKRLGVWAAAFLSASIFSILHTNIVGFLPIMALGVLLAYLYEKTGSLIASMAVHIVHNSIIVAFVFFVKEVIG